jgi:hypothetical protein
VSFPIRISGTVWREGWWNGSSQFKILGDGGRPLHAAALWGYLENARYLVSNGADVNARNKAGRTSAEETLRFGDSENRRKTREFLLSR